MLTKLYSKLSNFTKKVFGGFFSDETEEVINEIIRPEAINWSVSDNYTIGAVSYAISELASNNTSSPIALNATSPQVYPSLDDPASLLSQGLLDEARRYPVDFTREELY